MPDEPPARDPQDPLDPSPREAEASPKKPTLRERADVISERADTAKRAVEARAEVLRTRHASVRLAYQAYERDRRQAGALLAGGIAYRLFLWLLPTALFAVGIVGLLADISSTSPERVAHDAGFGAALALTVGQAAQQSGKGSLSLILLGGVLALWAGRAAVKALILTASVAWGMRPPPLTRGLVKSLTFSGICIGLMLLSGLLNILHRGPLGTDLLLELVTLAGMVALSVWMQSVLPHEEGAPWTAFVPGAFVLAVGSGPAAARHPGLPRRQARSRGRPLRGARRGCGVHGLAVPRRATDRRLRRGERRDDGAPQGTEATDAEAG